MAVRTDENLAEDVEIRTAQATIPGILSIPRDPVATIVFAHGAGSSRLSRRNRSVAEVLARDHCATLLVDLLSEREKRLDSSGRMSFDIGLLAGRVDAATQFVLRQQRLSSEPVGYFGASTGAAAALVAAIQWPQRVRAVVCRGGRTDLAQHVLGDVRAATLLIVGSQDTGTLAKNEQALHKLTGDKRLVVIPGASHLFQEPGALQEVATHTRRWFRDHLLQEDCPMEVEETSCHIEAYAFGQMTVSGHTYSQDLIVFPDRVKPHWRRGNGHILRVADLDEVLPYRPDLLVIGTGASGRMQLEAAARDFLRQESIPFVEQDTGKAVKTFNRGLDVRMRVVGAFHLTC